MNKEHDVMVINNDIENRFLNLQEERLRQQQIARRETLEATINNVFQKEMVIFLKGMV